MTKTFTIANELSRSAAINAISQLDISEPHDVTIKPIKRNRTTAQHGLYFHWVGCVANYSGDDKESTHEYLKGKFLLPIFVRDSEGYAALYETVIDAVMAGGDKAKKAMATLKKETSITRASQDQMREYLDEINRFCANNGIPLTVPDQYMWLGR